MKKLKHFICFALVFSLLFHPNIFVNADTIRTDTQVKNISMSDLEIVADSNDSFDVERSLSYDVHGDDNQRISIDGQELSGQSVEINLPSFVEDAEDNNGLQFEPNLNESVDMDASNSTKSANVVFLYMEADPSSTDSSNNFVVGNTAIINFGFKNIGTSPVTNVSMAVYVDGIYKGMVMFSGSLPPGYEHHTFLEIDGADEGNHTVRLGLNTGAEISKTFTWTGAPDLTVTSFTASKNAILEGEDISFQFTLENIGNGNASRMFYTAVLVDGESIGAVSLSELKAGQTASGSFNLAFMERGTYAVQILVDYYDHIPESNENNNKSNMLHITVRPEVVWPVPGLTRMSRGFDLSIPHKGLDISPKTPGVPGDTIVAFASGTVSLNWYSSSYGNVVYINTPDIGGYNWVQHRYAHMDKLSPLVVGAAVSAGDFVGEMGNTGDSRGVHLHFETRSSNVKPDNGDSSIPFDPIPVFFPTGFASTYMDDGTEISTQIIDLLEAPLDGPLFIKGNDGKLYSIPMIMEMDISKRLDLGITIERLLEDRDDFTNDQLDILEVEYELWHEMNNQTEIQNHQR